MLLKYANIYHEMRVKIKYLLIVISFVCVYFLVRRGGMLQLYGESGERQRQGVHNANEITLRGDMEDCDADCQKACGECSLLCVWLPFGL